MCVCIYVYLFSSSVLWKSLKNTTAKMSTPTAQILVLNTIPH